MLFVVLCLLLMECLIEYYNLCLLIKLCITPILIFNLCKCVVIWHLFVWDLICIIRWKLNLLYVLFGVMLLIIVAIYALLCNLINFLPLVMLCLLRQNFIFISYHWNNLMFFVLYHLFHLCQMYLNSGLVPLMVFALIHYIKLVFWLMIMICTQLLHMVLVIPVCLRICLCLYICMFICLCLCLCIYLSPHICMFIWLYLCICL